MPWRLRRGAGCGGSPPLWLLKGLSVGELEEQILAAVEAGDHQRLRALQARFRSSAVVSSATRGGPPLPVRLIESPAARPLDSFETRVRPAPSWHLPERLGSKEHKRSTVTISATARAAILAEIDRSWPELVEGVEVGGWILGDVLASEIRVVSATASGQRGHDCLSLNLRHAAAEEARSGARLLGDWHTHNTILPPTPSEADVTAWTENAEALGRDYVGVIASSLSWLDSEVELGAWRADGPTVEPIEVKESNDV
jgi:hypothetical protein